MSQHVKDLDRVAKENLLLPKGYSIILNGTYLPIHDNKVVFKRGFTNLRDTKMFLVGYQQCYQQAKDNKC